MASNALRVSGCIHFDTKKMTTPSRDQEAVAIVRSKAEFPERSEEDADISCWLFQYGVKNGAQDISHYRNPNLQPVALP